MKCKLILHLEEGLEVLWAEQGENLLSALALSGRFPVDAPCSGLGKCGKCRVRLRRGAEAPGWVLACQTQVDGPMELWPGETALLAETGGTFARPAPDPAPQGALGLALDLGTTTVAASLFDLHSGQLLGSQGEANRQRRFGADVLSRISFAAAHGQAALTQALQQQLRELGQRLCAQAGRDAGSICRIAAAGNTVMEHFLAGLDVQGLGVAPFRPESLFGCTMELGLAAPVYLAPCPAGYVGGDITAGLLALDAGHIEAPFLLLDAGTNGEMVLGQGGKLLCCATAVGPAFEGAEIACGMSGAPGAVDAVTVDGAGALHVHVLGGGPAKGICGSGLIDILACMLELGLLTESGRLLKPEEAPPAARPYLGQAAGEAAFFLPGSGVYVTAGDVRRLQLAKAAVRAGVEILLTQVKALPERVFLAGGFGSRMRPESALRIGMLPGCLAGRIRGVGNSALAGAANMLLSQSAREEAQRLRDSMEYRELSGNAAFSEAYMEAMAFDEL